MQGREPVEKKLQEKEVVDSSPSMLAAPSEFLKVFSAIVDEKQTSVLCLIS